MRKIALLLFATMTLMLAACAPVRAVTGSPFKVFYAGETGGVQTALELAEKAGTLTLVTNPASADVLFLNGEAPQPETLAKLVSQGAGLVLVLGPGISSETVSSLLGQKVSLAVKDDAISLTNAPGAQNSLLTEIIWNGAPQVRERLSMNSSMLAGQPMVTAYEDGEWVLWQAAAHTYVFNALLDQANPQIQEWPYFNYLVYHLAAQAAGQTPLSFADFPASPVPHSTDQNVLFIFLGLELAGFFGAFILVRHYSLRHPEALDSLVGNQGRFEVQEARTAWEDIGFHRPLSGLLVGICLGVVLFIPLIIYQNMILPQLILPSAQALGIWGRVTQFFALTWTIFDMGTAAASMKFMSQYRVADPRRGIKYLQTYVWWQALSGAIQVAIVVAVTSTGVVRTPYALYAWSIIIHAMIQIPGFYQVMRNTLNSLQRNDYARYMDTAYSVILPIIAQGAVVPLFYWWGLNHPAIGGALGGVLGMGVAAYLLELIVFVIGLWLYKRLGYKAHVLFMAHFDWGIIKEAFRFGIFEMLGGTMASAGAAAEIWITQTRLINYTEIWGNWALAQNFVFAFTVCTNLFDGVMPAISEAISHGRKLLSQYYSVQSYKWGAIASGFLAAVLLAVAPKFIIGSSGVEFQRAAIYVVPLIFWGAIQYPAWLSDSIFLGSNRPIIRALMIVAEQVTRITLALILLARFQITGLIIAYLIALLGRGVAGYFVAHKVCFPQRFFFWQSIGAVVLALGAHYLFISLLASFIWQGEAITSILLFLVGILPSLPVYLFFYALFGGWDQATLAELKQAVDLTGFLRGFANVMIYLPSKWGARLSPLHDRFPITIREAALEEARSLTQEKVKLTTLKA